MTGYNFLENCYREVDMSSVFNVMVIDDDTRLRTLLGKFLQENNFNVTLAKDASEARDLLESQSFDILIVDVMMPGENGIDFTSHLRKISSFIPVIMLTARGEPTDRINGLEAGADDYLPKPFEPKELLLRINNILRYSKQKAVANVNGNVCAFGEFTFAHDLKHLKRGEEFIHITESEAKILNILCQEKGQIISREKLSELCSIDDRSVDVQITRLRKKIEINPKKPNYLQTARNQGYVLRG
jgi:two-component system phosphate regulon response regulator OmpR